VTTLAPDGGVAQPVRALSARELQIRQVRVCGTTLRVAIWPGASGGTPLLMFNGIGASFELLAPFADALGDIEVIAFDVPGTGESGRAPVPYRLWMLGLLATRLLVRLGHSQVDVLGVSWGGAAAQQFAVQNPHRCRRLVLAATSPGVLMVPPNPTVLSKFMTPRRFNDAEYRQRIAGEIYGGRARGQSDVIKEFRRTSRTGYLLQQLAIAGWSSLPWLRFVRQPTLIMAGSDDPIIPLVNARMMARVIPDSRLRVFEDGHLFLISAASEAGPMVHEFLTAATVERGRS
jgi:poly(3-hydroxyalkanoate) depolymerase